LDREGLSCQGVLRRRQVNEPEDREWSHRGRRCRKSAGRDERSLPAAYARIDGDGLKLPTAAASAGQNQRSCQQEKDESGEILHGNSPLHILTRIAARPLLSLRNRALALKTPLDGVDGCYGDVSPTFAEADTHS
jgi:hypothetical protein